MSNTKNKSFLDRVRKTPGFGFTDELNELVDRHGPDTPELLQAIVDAKLLALVVVGIVFLQVIFLQMIRSSRPVFTM